MKTCSCCHEEMILAGTSSTNGQYWTCRKCGNIELPNETSVNI